MSSKTDIINLAIQMLGNTSVTSVDDNTPSARAIKLCYDVVRKAQLRRHLWNFAMKRAQPAAISDTPLFGYSKMATLPTDCLRLVDVTNCDDYTLENYNNRRVILSDVSPLNIIYVADIDNEGLYDAEFVQVFAAALAMQVARSLTDSETAFERVAAIYKDAFSAATQTDGKENPPDDIPLGSWNEARD